MKIYVKRQKQIIFADNKKREISNIIIPKWHHRVLYKLFNKRINFDLVEKVEE